MVVRKKGVMSKSNIHGTNHYVLYAYIRWHNCRGTKYVCGGIKDVLPLFLLHVSTSASRYIIPDTLILFFHGTGMEDIEMEEMQEMQGDFTVEEVRDATTAEPVEIVKEDLGVSLEALERTTGLNSQYSEYKVWLYVTFS